MAEDNEHQGAVTVHSWLGHRADIEDGWVAAAPEVEVVEGQPRAADVVGHPVVLVRFEGTVYAMDGYCPHRGMLLTDGKQYGPGLRCIWHGFEYDVRNGDAIWPDDCGPQVPVYDTRIRDGMVEVRVRTR